MLRRLHMRALRAALYHSHARSKVLNASGLNCHPEPLLSSQFSVKDIQIFVWYIGFSRRNVYLCTQRACSSNGVWVPTNSHSKCLIRTWEISTPSVIPAQDAIRLLQRATGHGCKQHSPGTETLKAVFPLDGITASRIPSGATWQPPAAYRNQSSASSPFPNVRGPTSTGGLNRWCGRKANPNFYLLSNLKFKDYGKASMWH